MGIDRQAADSRQPAAVQIKLLNLTLDLHRGFFLRDRQNLPFSTARRLPPAACSFFAAHAVCRKCSVRADNTDSRQDGYSALKMDVVA
jgi:hypothetical protein